LWPQGAATYQSNSSCRCQRHNFKWTCEVVSVSCLGLELQNYAAKEPDVYGVAL